MQLAGLPEGIEPVRFGIAEAGEYLWDGAIRGPMDRVGSAEVLIIQPASGYDFTYDIATDTTVVVEAYAKPQGLLVKFEITNERDERMIRAALAKLPGLRFINGLPCAPAKQRS
jgi:hypothetical protein